MEPSRVDKHADQSVYIQLADVLREDIESGRLAPGQRLPSERELHERHGIARGTVREALNRLKSEGLITVEHGRGAFVRGAPERVQVRLARRGAGMPATVVTAIAEAGRQVSVRPLGAAPGTSGAVQAAAIVFADGIPLGIWRACVRSDDSSWPADLGAGIHKAFPPASTPRHRTEIRARAVQAEDRRLLQVRAGEPVVVVESSYQSTSGPVTHVATFAAERVALVVP